MREGMKELWKIYDGALGISAFAQEARRRFPELDYATVEKIWYAFDVAVQHTAPDSK
jgi:hypothetical protein